MTLTLTRYKRTPVQREVGYVIDENTVQGEWDGMSWADVPRKAALYANDTRAMRILYAQGKCEAIYWKKSARIRSLTGWKFYHPKGYTNQVYYLRSALARVPEHERLSAILAFVDFVRGLGGGVSSPTGMLNSVLRVSLPDSFRESSFGVPVDYIWRGSRVQQVTDMRSDFGPTDLWDMRSAFPSTLSHTALPRKWREYESKMGEDIPGAESGFAYAYVHVPWFKYGPLPDTMREHPDFPVDQFIHGVWSLDELRVAESVGCEVLMLRYWVGSSYRHPFEEWGRLVTELRESIDRNAVQLVKMAANRFVGKYAMDGHRERSYIDKTGKEKWIIEQGHKYPDSLTVHGLVTSEVRSRLFAEGIHPYPAHFVFCHTDGVALDAGAEALGHPPTPDWQVKAYMERLLLVNPQRYAYRPGAEDIEPGDWRYVVAGVPQPGAEGFFRKRWLKVPAPPADGTL